MDNANIDKSEGKRIYDEKTARILDGLHRTAASEALGCYEVYRAENVGSDEKPRIKYIKLTDKGEIDRALEWIAEYGQFAGKYEEGKGAPFIVRAAKADHKFYESLTARLIGKAVEEVRVTQDVNVYQRLAEKAHESRKSAPKTSIPSFYPFRRGDIVPIKRKDSAGQECAQCCEENIDDGTLEDTK